VKLATEEAVINRMGLTARVGTESSSDSGLLAATTQIENTIGTSFAREDRVDYFGCVYNVGSQSQPEYLLNLTNSILDVNERVRLYVTSDGTPIKAVTGIDANVTLIDPSLYEVNRKQGYVNFYADSSFANANVRKSIAIRYVSGFDVNADDVANPDQVPNAIQEGAITLAIKIMRGSSAPKPKIGQNLLYSQQELMSMAHAQIANFIRTRLRGDHPAATELR
jgi:hypothetical protein